MLSIGQPFSSTRVGGAAGSAGFGWRAMRPLRSFHVPGIDVLCDAAEYTTAKQAQSIARQFGRPGVLSELYGVTNWDFDFVGHKAQGDWQAACGVTVRVPHLAWLTPETLARSLTVAVENVRRLGADEPLLHRVV